MMKFGSFLKAKKKKKKPVSRTRQDGTDECIVLKCEDVYCE